MRNQLLIPSFLHSNSIYLLSTSEKTCLCYNIFSHVNEWEKCGHSGCSIGTNWDVVFLESQNNSSVFLLPVCPTHLPSIAVGPTHLTFNAVGPNYLPYIVVDPTHLPFILMGPTHLSCNVFYKSPENFALLRSSDTFWCATE